MISYCSYEGCLNYRFPCSKITFFRLPQDSRRQIWIENSGNPNLKNINNKSMKIFCEAHFNPKYIRRQFNRAILYKYAVPYKYENTKQIQPKSLLNDEIANKNDMKNIENLNQVERQEQTEFIECSSTKSQENEINLDIISVDGELYEILTEDDKNDDITSKSSNVNNLELDVPVEDEIHNFNVINDYCEPESIITNEILENDKIEYEIEENYKTSNICAEENISDYVAPIKMSKTSLNNEDYENDKHFALSLVGNFQRLKARKKAFAKLKILQFLTELEFSETDDINISIK